MVIEWRGEVTKYVTVGYLVEKGGGGIQNDEKVCYVILMYDPWAYCSVHFLNQVIAVVYVILSA